MGFVINAMNITSNYQILPNKSLGTSFKAGYNSQIKLAERVIDPQKVENFFKHSSLRDWRSFYNIDLKNNKAIALGNYLCAKIFEEFRKFYDLRQGHSTQSLIYPFDIYVYDEIERPEYIKSNFCVNHANLRFNPKKPVFETGTVFINNKVNSLDWLNDDAEALYKDGESSSNHFLRNFVHEWLHAAFNNIVKNRASLGYYDFDKTIRNYDRQQLSDSEKEMVCELIGSYPASVKHSQYAETYAESWTKFICESLSKDCMSFKKNPLDILKSMPKEFQELLAKVTDIKMLHMIGD